jgi:hypothetical protein
MNDPLRQAGFLQITFTQAEGELRSKPLFRRDGVTATSAGSELLIAGAGNGRPIRYRIPHAYPHNPKVENNSIPIEHGPAQFNAFYPQCSGQKLGLFHQD